MRGILAETEVKTVRELRVGPGGIGFKETGTNEKGCWVVDWDGRVVYTKGSCWEGGVENGIVLGITTDSDVTFFAGKVSYII